jgi:hypothetical protein
MFIEMFAMNDAVTKILMRVYRSAQPYVPKRTGGVFIAKLWVPTLDTEAVAEGGRAIVEPDAAHVHKAIRPAWGTLKV